MGKIVLNLDTLGQLDPRVKLAFDRELKRVVDDCIDRPGDESSRKVTMTAIITPKAVAGVLEAVDVEFDFDSKIPKVRSRAYEAGVHGSGKLFVNPASIRRRSTT